MISIRKKSLPRSFVFVIILIVATFLTIGFISQQLSWGDYANKAVRLVSFNQVVSDFLIFSSLFIYLVRGAWIARTIAYTLLILFSSIYFIQCFSLYLSKAYVTQTAFSNVQHIALILNASNVSNLLAYVTILAIVIFISEYFLYHKASSQKKYVRFSLACLLFAFFISLDKYYLTEGSITSRLEIYTLQNQLKYKSLIRLFVKELRLAIGYQQKLNPLSEADLAAAKKYGFYLNPKSKLPLQKNRLYNDPLPFQQATSNKVLSDNTPVNVIIIFAEGMSARSIQPYDSFYKQLTPNIADFAQHSMQVDNYFNHTFATYRGLLGQLCSIYPKNGGGDFDISKKYYCLPNILNEDGYKTEFVFSQMSETTKLDELFQLAGFQHIYGAERLNQYLTDPELEAKKISDQQLFTATIERLKYYEKNTETPFFLGLYNLETHALLKPPESNLKYKHSDSYVLDTIHNFDDAFGHFWKYFKKSSLYGNTIVIFTADHAHFQDKDYRKIISHQESYKPIFVDRIPLLIFHPKTTLPETFDADFSTSIDLAPTLLHLLGTQNRKNSLLGKSIFSKKYKGLGGFSFSEDIIFHITKDKIESQDNYQANVLNNSTINKMYKVLSHTQTMPSPDVKVLQ